MNRRSTHLDPHGYFTLAHLGLALILGGELVAALGLVALILKGIG